MSDFWLQSGIKNSFTYEMLDCQSLNTSYGFLEGVTSCKITESYESDTRVSGTLEVSGVRPGDGYAIRIRHKAECGGDTKEQVIGTFMVGSDSPKYLYGQYSGQINLVSMLDRFSQDYVTSDIGVSGWNACDWFEEKVTDGQGIAWVNPNVSRDSIMSDWVWEFGTSLLSALFTCAEKINGRVGVDELGRVTLNPYNAPSALSSSFTIDGYTLSAGLERTDGDRVNRVGVKYQPSGDGETQFATARLAATHEYSMEKLGRWLTKVYEVNQGENDASTTAQELADYYLSINNATTHKWEGSGLYRPIACGEVGEINYLDTEEGTPLSFKALLRQKEYNLDAAMETKYIFSQIS